MSRPRTLLAALAALIAIGGVVFTVSRIERNETIQPDRTATAEAVGKAAEILAKDSDNDGLKDWEEELWKTDAQNPDTDKDGAPDGEEIRLGRDPLKSGPDDLLDRETIAEKTNPSGSGTRKLTLSEQISRELFSQYMAAKQGGRAFTADDEKQILLHFFNNPPPLAETVRYSEKDLPASAGGVAALHDYGNDLASILLSHADPKGENELLTLQSAVDSEDPAKLEKLAARRTAYQGATKDLLTIPTPPEAIALHLDLLNAVAAMEQGVSGMQIVFADPVKALATIGQYPQGLDQFYATISAIGKMLVKEKVEFGTDEPGARLTK